MEETEDQALMRIRKRGSIELPKPLNWNPKFNLLPYQQVGALHLIIKKKYILGAPTGSGKTPMALWAWGVIRDSRLSEGLNPRLWIVANKSATTQWESEIKNFLPGINIYRPLSESGAKKRVQTVGSWLKDKTGSVLITNWAQFRDDWDKIRESFGETWLEEVQLILDEAHKIRNPESKLGSVAKELITKVDRAHLLTASAVHNKAHDAYALASVLDNKLMSLAVFEKLYCEKELIPVSYNKWHKRNHWKIVGYRNLTEFKERIAHLYLGRNDDEIEGQRPKISYMMRTGEMSTAQKRVYLKAEMGEYLENQETNNAAGAMIQAQQVVNTPEYLEPECKDSIKVDLLKEILDEIGEEPAIAYSQFRSTIDSYMEVFKEKRPVRITGSEDEEQRFKSQEAFQTGKTNLLFLTDAGSESINLQRAKHVIFISRPWAPGNYRQIVGRARRFGSVHEYIVIWHLTIEDTIDEYVDALLAQKFGPVEEIIQGRGDLLPDDQVLPLEIAEYARKKRKETKPKRIL